MAKPRGKYWWITIGSLWVLLRVVLPATPTQADQSLTLKESSSVNRLFPACKAEFHANSISANPSCRQLDDFIPNPYVDPNLPEALKDAAQIDSNDPNDLNKILADIDHLKGKTNSVSDQSKNEEALLVQLAAKTASQVKQDYLDQKYQAEMLIACLNGKTGPDSMDVSAASLSQFVSKGICKKTLGDAAKKVANNYPRMRTDLFLMNNIDTTGVFKTPKDPGYGGDCAMGGNLSDATKVYGLGHCHLSSSLNNAQNAVSPYDSAAGSQPAYTAKEDKVSPVKNAKDCVIADPYKSNPYVDNYPGNPVLNGSAPNADLGKRMAQTDAGYIKSSNSQDNPDNPCEQSAALNRWASYVKAHQKDFDKGAENNGWSGITSDFKNETKTDYLKTLAKSPALMPLLNSAADPSKNADAKKDWLHALETIRDNADKGFHVQIKPADLASPDYLAAMDSVLSKEPQLCGSAQTLLNMQSGEQTNRVVGQVALGIGLMGGCAAVGWTGVGGSLCLIGGGLLTAADLASTSNTLDLQNTRTFSSAIDASFHGDMKNQLNELEAAQSSAYWSKLMAPTALIGGGQAIKEVAALAKGARAGAAAVEGSAPLIHAAEESLPSGIHPVVPEGAAAPEARAIAQAPATDSSLWTGLRHLADDERAKLAQEFKPVEVALADSSKADREQIEDEIADLEGRGVPKRQIDDALNPCMPPK